jgi:molecular chaperone GrpE
MPAAHTEGAVEKLQEDLRTAQDRNLRTLADFSNYRRRMEKDSNKLAEEGKREILFSLLSVVDDLENALRWKHHGGEALVEGLTNIHQKLIALLASHGVHSFDAAGRAFTPDLHEAVALAERPDMEPGTIVEVLRQGYLWKDVLFRPAQVQVAE